MAALDRERVLVELPPAVEVVRGAVLVVGEVAAVCAETWMAESSVIASSRHRRAIARYAMFVQRLPETMNVAGAQDDVRGTTVGEDFSVGSNPFSVAMRPGHFHLQPVFHHPGSARGHGQQMICRVSIVLQEIDEAKHVPWSLARGEDAREPMKRGNFPWQSYNHATAFHQRLYQPFSSPLPHR